MCNLGPTWRKYSPVSLAGKHLGIQTVGYRLASGESKSIGDAFVTAGDAPTRAFHGWIRKTYKDATSPKDYYSAPKYEYVPPAKTQQSLYTYDAGQNYQPVQQAYQPTEESNTVKVIEEDSDRTKINNT